MKKKIFLMIAIISMLACLFAISASAAAIPAFGETEHIDIDTATDGVQEMDIYSHLQTVVADGANTSASARVLLNCSCAKGQHTYPSYYITKKDGGNYFWTNYNDINKYNACGKSYGNSDVVAIEIPNGMKAMTNQFKGNTTIQFLDMSTAETMEYVETGTGYNAVSNCTSLIEVRIPASMTEIRGWSFFGCTALERFIIPEDSELTFIGTYSFYGCTSLTAFYLPSKVKTFGTQGGTNMGVFAGCTNVYLVNEPVTPTYLPEKPDVYYFPSTFEKLSGEEFKNCKAMNKIVVFPETFTTATDKWSFTGASTETIVFLGNMEKADIRDWSCKTIYFANKADLSSSNIATLSGSHTKVYCNAEGNETHLYLVNETIEADCENNAKTQTRCFCGAVDASSIKEEENSALGHDHDYINGKATLLAIAYADYSKAGTKTVKCGNCGKETEIEAAAILIYKGYSKNDKGGVCVGYRIDQAALVEYEAFSKTTISYGFAVAANNANPLDANGNAVANAIKVELSGVKYTAVDFVLTAEDWTTGPASEAKLSINMYVIVNNAVKYITANGYSDTAEEKTYAEI